MIGHGSTAQKGPLKLDAAVRAAFDLPWSRARALVTSGKIRVNGAVVTDGTRNVREGSEIDLDMAAPRPNRSKIENDRIVYVDAHVIVVSKPPGVSTVAYDESETDTLDERVRRMIEAKEKSSRKGRASLGVVHRLDKETSGLLIFTRTWLAKQSLTQQFRAHTVHL
ncbi:MAG: pseudouridine synthase, partial [Polyangiaceae bacterium]